MAEAPQIAADTHSLAAAVEVADRLFANIEQVVLGKHEEITLVLSALTSGGHVLLEDVPGTAKTILANIVLVDEINRAMPRTQSALLEAMAERQVTIDGVTRQLPSPFLVIATENPIEQEGTFPLPEAQLDRFALRSALGYPKEAEEIEIVIAQRHGHPLAALEPRVTGDAVDLLRSAVEDVYVDDLILRWIVDLVRASRVAEGVATGASVRGSLTLERTARAWALLHGRGHVVPDDVDVLFLPVLGHRLLLTPSFVAETRALGRAQALRQIKERCLALAPPPAPDWDTRAGS